MSIDIGKAAFSGFGLIGRRPLSVLVWGLTYLLLLGLPSLYFLSQIAPAYMQLISTVEASHAAGQSPEEANAAVMQMMPMFQKASALGWLINGLGIVIRGVLIAAVLRAVIEPENKGFFYLRIGAQEGWQMLLALAIGVLTFVLFFVVFIVAAILAALMGSLGEAAGVARALVILIAAVFCIIIVLRLSLAPAMTFKDRTFRLFESWTLTRSHTGALFAIVLILIVLVVLFELIVCGGIFAYIFSNKDALKAHFQTHPDPSAIIKSMTPFIIGAVCVGSLLSGAFLAIFIAPFATVYKQLTAGAPAST